MMLYRKFSNVKHLLYMGTFCKEPLVFALWPQALKQSPLHDSKTCYVNSIESFIPPEAVQELASAKNHADEKKILKRYNLLSEVHCDAHQQTCQVGEPDLNLSGPNCEDYSPAGLGQGREGQRSKYFLILIKDLIERKTPMVIIENVCKGEFTEVMSETYLMDLTGLVILALRLFHYDRTHMPTWCCLLF